MTWLTTRAEGSQFGQGFRESGSFAAVIDDPEQPGPRAASSLTCRNPPASQSCCGGQRSGHGSNQGNTSAGRNPVGNALRGVPLGPERHGGRSLQCYPGGRQIEPCRDPRVLCGGRMERGGKVGGGRQPQNHGSFKLSGDVSRFPTPPRPQAARRGWWAQGTATLLATRKPK